ncbi:rod shape-determining protein MreD [Mesobaculum littorinae]|uniref:Rod shape-determining protein MreD n=1 Tax=Mesobaculum littorinae TaxID=2486419 RepID=A0A438ADL1_9RHOB|nr:rod shape-determining protein MreD [Mesobaculum littorinae]RVV96755.1 rod shape-determining protein MreD [Mesobaculum littorinae]
MVDPVSTRRLVYRLGFVALAAGFIFLRLLPFEVSANRVPGPDLPVIFAFAWVLRRPDYVPATMIAAVMLVCDILFMRPLGLWAAIVLIGLEFLRARENLSRDLPFVVEWLMVAATLATMTLAQIAVLGLFVVPQPALQMSLAHLAVTVLSYPAAVVISRYALGVTKAAPGAVDALGHKL